ncbi:MAG TPA: class I SAM-dependent methyltransferase [bacterium]|nr:class I SAM-dependent methyltransferase [bacterium]
MRGYRRDPERTVIRTLARRAPLQGARVIDIGCGEGRLTRQIAGVARSVYAVDPDAAVLARAIRLTAPRLRKRILYRPGTAERPGVAGRRFDVAVFSGSL